MKNMNYDTHMQEVCDTLAKMAVDPTIPPEGRLIATKQLIELEHLVAHGDEAEKVIAAMKETTEEMGNKALKQLKKLEPKKQPWEDEEED